MAFKSKLHETELNTDFFRNIENCQSREHTESHHSMYNLSRNKSTDNNAH